MRPAQYVEDARGRFWIIHGDIRKVLQTMQAEKIDINTLIQPQDYSFSTSPHTMIVHAVQQGDEDSVRLLLELKAEPEYEKDPRWSIMSKAIGDWGNHASEYQEHINQRGVRCRIVSMLLPRLHNPEYGSPLRCAIHNRDADMFDMLRRAGCKQWQPSLELGRPRELSRKMRGKGSVYSSVPQPEASRWDVLLHSDTNGTERDKRRIFMGLLTMHSMTDSAPVLSSPRWETRIWRLG